MVSIARSLQFVAAPVLIVALGCSTTSSTPAPAPNEAPPAPIAKAPQPDEARHAPVEFGPVYFDTDLAVLQPDSRKALNRVAKQILAHPEWRVVRIDGHCDERGSDQYNLDLGEQRAEAVERYLVNLGVPASRLTTHSFGARSPAVPGHDEEAWRYNRRSELRPADDLALR